MRPGTTAQVKNLVSDGHAEGGPVGPFENAKRQVLYRECAARAIR
jgi:hypothetical protein